MKEFRKNQHGYFICEECERPFKNTNALAKHLYFSHDGNESYFYKWIKDDTDNCVICGNETRFISFYNGCANTCTKACKRKLRELTNLKIYGVKYPTQNKEIIKKSQATCIKKYGSISFTGSSEYKKSIKSNYGVENVYQLERVKEKCKRIHIKKLGVENPSQSYIVKRKKEETCLKNYGVKYPFQNLEIQEKSRQSNLKNNGVEFPMQSSIIRDKSKKTCIKKYGVEFIHQNKDIHEKSQKTAKTFKQYKDSNIFYRGSYELDFLDKYFLIYSDMTNPKSIKYFFNNTFHWYHPDFYIPSLNLIIEIKNSYLMKRNKNQIIAKKDAAINNGFNYILIIDKNYDEFEKLLK